MAAFLREHGRVWDTVPANCLPAVAQAAATPTLRPGEDVTALKWADVVKEIPRRVSATAHVAAVATPIDRTSFPHATYRRVDQEVLDFQKAGSPAWVWALVAGRYVTLVCDTGAHASIITDRLADMFVERLGITRGRVPFDYAVMGLGGRPFKIKEYVTIPLWICGATPDTGLWISTPFLIAPEGGIGPIMLLGNGAMDTLGFIVNTPMRRLLCMSQPHTVVPLSCRDDLTCSGWGDTKSVQTPIGKMWEAPSPPKSSQLPDRPVERVSYLKHAQPASARLQPLTTYLDELEAARVSLALPPFDTEFKCSASFEKILKDPKIFHIACPLGGLPTSVPGARAREGVRGGRRDRAQHDHTVPGHAAARTTHVHQAPHPPQACGCHTAVARRSAQATAVSAIGVNTLSEQHPCSGEEWQSSHYWRLP
jgi:hypothetical protein